MAGEGFSKHASTSSRENRNLRRKKSMFKKERTFLNQKSSQIKTNVQEIITKKPSRYELSKIKEAVLNDRRKQFITSLWVVFVCAFVFWYFTDMAFESQKEFVERSVEEVEARNYQEELKQYNYLIESGDEWYNQEKYYNAAFQYRLALEIFPKDTIAFERLMIAYDLNCLNSKRNCGKSDELQHQFYGD